MLINAEPEFDFALEMAKKHGAKPGSEMSLYLDYKRHFRPEVIRTDPAKMAQALENMRSALETLEDGMGVELPNVMKQAGLDPANRSDAAHARRFLNESELLQHNSATPERWVRRLTTNGGTTNSTAAD